MYTATGHGSTTLLRGPASHGCTKGAKRHGALRTRHLDLTTAILFLSGLLCDEAVWRRQMAEFGHLGQVAAADLTLDDTIVAMAERAAGTVAGQFAIVALSMGGYVAFEMLRRCPDRISSVALFDSSAAPDTAARAAERRDGIAALSLGRFLGATRRLMPRLIHPTRLDGPVAEEVQSMALRVGGDAYRRQQLAILGRADSRPSLPAIRVPTLVAVGRQDTLTPPYESQVIQRAVPGARLHIFERCGHLPPLECPEEVTALLAQWLPARL